MDTKSDTYRITSPQLRFLHHISDVQAMIMCRCGCEGWRGEPSRRTSACMCHLFPPAPPGKSTRSSEDWRVITGATGSASFAGQVSVIQCTEVFPGRIVAICSRKRSFRSSTDVSSSLTRTLIASDGETPRIKSFIQYSRLIFSVVKWVVTLHNYHVLLRIFSL